MRKIAMLLTLLVLGSLVGCSRKEAPPPGKPTRISATKAFESYFGPAPTTDKGTCYAFLIYFPSAKEAGKVKPFPFFSFDESSLKKIALTRLIGGMDEKSYAPELLRLFPVGSRLLSLEEHDGTVTANFSKEVIPVAADPNPGQALYNAVTLTLMQFNGVKQVRIQSEGKDLFPPVGQPPPETSSVVPPSPPRLLNVVAMKEKPAAPVQEVDALFDRPVTITELQFLNADGSVLAGDVFQSMFDMAAILKPRDAAKLTDGTQVRVRYKVVDKMGRGAAGEGSFALQVKLHQD